MSSAVIERYRDPHGRPRELCALRGPAGSTLVVDRDARARRDQRLLAHLAPDEPPGNALLVCRRYLEHAAPPRCRPLRPSDRRRVPLAEMKPKPPRRAGSDACVQGRDGSTYRLGLVGGPRGGGELRWLRAPDERAETERVSLRDVVGASESYEPARSLTEHALRDARDDETTSVARLCWELERLQASPVVLNRGLREAVQGAVRRGETSMSDVARRCGMVKRDRGGRLLGETSWVARRIGAMPPGGTHRPTPWVHTDVLALIAREGLGISPREVELS